MLAYLASGALFGLAGGFGPGPLMTLVVSESLQRGTREGLKVSVAPLVTDAPIFLAALFLVEGLSELGVVLGMISLFGAALVVAMGIATIRARTPEVASVKHPRHAVWRGAAVNALNPSPYIFWFAIGAPEVLRAYDGVGALASVGFVAAMYVCLVGGKMVVAAVVGRSRRFIRPRVYRVIMVTLGVALCLFAVLLLRDALAYFGWWGGDAVAISGLR